MKIPSDDAFIELLSKTWNIEEKIEDNVFKQDVEDKINIFSSC